MVGSEVVPPGSVAGAAPTRLSLAEPVSLSPGEVAPVACSFEFRRIRLSVPLGAYVAEPDRIRFVPTFDVVGLGAALAGIFIGWRVAAKALDLPVQLQARKWTALGRRQ